MRDTIEVTNTLIKERLHVEYRPTIYRVYRQIFS